VGITDRGGSHPLLVLLNKFKERISSCFHVFPFMFEKEELRKGENNRLMRVRFLTGWLKKKGKRTWNRTSSFTVTWPEKSEKRKKSPVFPCLSTSN